MSKAMICGVGGQDGAYLARFLLERGYEVIGTSRDAEVSSFSSLTRLGIRDRVAVESMALNDFRSVLQTIARFNPDEIYNLAGQTSVGLSFVQPVETLESISIGTLNLLEAIRFIGRPIKFYNAGSSECFGNIAEGAADETWPFRPRSPYAVAKAAAHWQVANYREAYRLFACSGILFNHESPLRPRRFVTSKIVAAACRIADGSRERLRLGNLDIKRDWGWAPEYVDAMWRMLQQPVADDYVIATGVASRLSDFVEAVFRRVGLTWTDHVDVDPSLFRPTDIDRSIGCPDKAEKILGWSARLRVPEIVDGMVAEEQRSATARAHGG